MFYIGVVEDNLDPLKLGRLRVRIYGIHTENRMDVTNQTQLVLTDELPWAYPAMPITNSSIDGISDFSTILPGTKVLLFFIDKHKQKPFYFAVLPFILEEIPDFNLGFSDPTQSFPTEDFKNESSISRLARNENIDKTIVKTKNDNAAVWNNNGVDIDEPDSAYNAQYPYNRVIETPGGIVVELDSTPGAERIHLYHPTNTYEEIQPDGTRVTKNTGNDFDITLQDKYVYVAGGLNVTIGDGASIEVGKDTLITCNGSVVLTLNGESVIDSTAPLGIVSSGEVDIISDTNVNVLGNNVNIKAINEVKIESAAQINATSIGELNLQGSNTTINALGTLTLSSTSTLNITSSGTVNVTGTLVSLN